MIHANSGGRRKQDADAPPPMESNWSVPAGGRRQLVLVDRWYPSSKTCSACGAVNKALTLNQRHWTCPSCGAEHDRDFNAAVNLEREGLRLRAVSNTPMSGEIDARGDLGAVAEAQVIALPRHRRSTNRELAARRCAPNRPKRRSGTGGKGGA